DMRVTHPARLPTSANSPRMSPKKITLFPTSVLRSGGLETTTREVKAVTSRANDIQPYTFVINVRCSSSTRGRDSASTAITSSPSGALGTNPRPHVQLFLLVFLTSGKAAFFRNTSLSCTTHTGQGVSIHNHTRLPILALRHGSGLREKLPTVDIAVLCLIV